jgi:16S rRNA U516 pseudouridylate synthase RsuA-like enzyme
MTNDGRLANFLMHPRYEHSKEYVVETFGSINDEQLDLMSD